MDVFVARQPIFNCHKRIYAYELLFRTGMANAFPDIDGETATSSLLSSSFFTVGIEQISGGNRAFINFTQDLLLRGTPAMFPSRNIVVEVLEDVSPDEKIIEACKELVANGYELALDDFVFSEAWRPLVEIAKIIKVDFMLTGMEEIKKIVDTVKPYGCQLLAEKIETYEEFTQARDMGFVYFQGYFFAKPEILQNKDIPSSQLSLFQLLAEINKVEFDVPAMERIINQDVSVSFKILKYLNSAYFSRLQPISSIRQAIAFLGERGVRQFVSLITTAKLSENKPTELIRSSIIRARFLEQVALAQGKKNSGDFFMLGLFSLIDAMLDNSMENLMKQLPLADSVKNALVRKNGDLYPYLEMFAEYEVGNWEKFDRAIQAISFDQHKVIEFYMDAVGWADSYQ